MCLYKGENKFEVAEEDIVCYKVVNYIAESKRYISYYQETCITFGQPITAKYKHDLDHLNDNHYLLGEVVHAFQTNHLYEIQEGS